MTRAALAAALLALAAAPLAAQRGTVVPRAGLVVTRSVTVRPGHYVLPAPDSGPLITVRGRGIVVRMDGVVLEGAPQRDAPDRFAGTAILVDGGGDVRIEGAVIRGYKVAIHARGTRRLVLARNTVSHNWRPRLLSGIEQESLVDWLSFHRNESNEWLRHGAGIYLERVDSGEVRDNVAEEGMNGLLLTRSEGLRIWNNDFRWLSGVGIGLYRSSGNTIMHNRVDWCVRGSSFGFYQRGQDSAALLLFEQSSSNVVAFNSMTHGGDGLFLWAGQQTMDTGEGGSNDNLFYMNDFSHAPTNGMEATFSRNRFVGNRVLESTHGLWGGYGWGSHVVGNVFGGNRVAIAIEHGQENVVAGNRFEGDTTAIRLWANRVEPGDWIYPKRRDTSSRGYVIARNAFIGNAVAIRAERTSEVRLQGNSYDAVDTLSLVRGDSASLGALVEEPRDGTKEGRGGVAEQEGGATDAARLVAELAGAVRPIAGARDAMLPPGSRRGRATIIVDEWGPYSWRYPKLWPAGGDDARPLPLRVLGPPGTWRLMAATGAGVSDSAGTVGDTLLVTPAGEGDDWRVELEYTGGPVVTRAGDTVAAGRPVRFSYERFRPALRWRVRAAAWDSAGPPPARAAIAPGTELLSRDDVAALDWMWFRPRIAGLPATHWLLAADTEVTLPPGAYALRTVSDDAVRVWVDGRPVVDHWLPHESAIDEAPLDGGRHRVEVEYLQRDGWVELRVEFLRR